MIKSRNGSHILVRDEGVDVKAVYVKVGKRLIAKPSVIEFFNFNIERARVLLLPTRVRRFVLSFLWTSEHGLMASPTGIPPL